MESVREVVKARDGIDDAEFDELLAWFKEELEENCYDPEDLVSDWFGLEPDYLMDPELGVFG